MTNARTNSRTIRLSTDLLQAAAFHGKASNRSTAQQIEFWAAIGRVAGPFLSPMDIVAISQGLLQITVETAQPANLTLVQSEETGASSDQ